MPNYGDIALNLKPDWARYKLNDQSFALLTIGHEDGVSDVRIETDPDKRHQFAWVLPMFKGQATEDVDINRTKGYVFVKKDDGWVKNPNLWEWDAEGFLVFKGQRLMARPAELFFADMAARKQQRERVMGTNRAEEEARQIAERAGISISGDDDGRPIKRRRSA